MCCRKTGESVFDNFFEKVFGNNEGKLIESRGNINRQVLNVIRADSGDQTKINLSVLWTNFI